MINIFHIKTKILPHCWTCSYLRISSKQKEREEKIFSFLSCLLSLHLFFRFWFHSLFFSLVRNSSFWENTLLLLFLHEFFFEERKEEKKKMTKQRENIYDEEVKAGEKDLIACNNYIDFTLLFSLQTLWAIRSLLCFNRNTVRYRVIVFLFLFPLSYWFIFVFFC